MPSACERVYLWTKFLEVELWVEGMYLCIFPYVLQFYYTWKSNTCICLKRTKLSGMKVHTGGKYFPLVSWLLGPSPEVATVCVYTSGEYMHMQTCICEQVYVICLLERNIWLTPFCFFSLVVQSLSCVCVFGGGHCDPLDCSTLGFPVLHYHFSLNIY